VWREQDDAAVEGALAAPDLSEAGGAVLLGKSKAELEALMVSLGQPKFRGKQVLDALLHGARSVDELRLVRLHPVSPTRRHTRCAQPAPDTARACSCHRACAPR